MICSDAAVLSTLVTSTRHLLVAPSVACIHRCTIPTTLGLHRNNVGARHLGSLSATSALHRRDSFARPTRATVTLLLTLVSIFCIPAPPELLFSVFASSLNINNNTRKQSEPAHLCQGNVVR